MRGGQKGRLQRAATARTADRKRTVHILAMIYIGRTRVMDKKIIIDNLRPLLLGVR